MKKLLLILIVFILLSCSADSIASLANELVIDSNRNYQVGLCTLCDDYSNITWYCLSKTEYNRLKALPKSCEIVTITASSGNKYSGVINSNSFKHSESSCYN